mmetsp:Transcript_2940/g.8617  ORF Transcript_2940/g.8617 Transcript_2940/m.8617 type:complete len:264 (-) Transcript_2940:41-832(-)
MARLLAKAKEMRENLYPTLKESAFLSRGVLTPEEFVAAGDELVFKCPTWAWAAGPPASRKAHLPADKQYLVTRNVPCAERASAVEGMGLAEEAVASDVGGEWVDTVLTSAGPGAAPRVDDCCAALEETDLNADDAAEGGDALLRTRTYDLSITYDKYWQSPRMWLFGYGEDAAPLTREETLEDILSAYALRTVTFERHPHAELPHASIHPCKHPHAMKRIIDAASKNAAGPPRVDQALFFFLKFIANMVPTINYDFTHDVVAG